MHDFCSFLIGSVVFFLLICSSSYFPYSKPWSLTFIVEIFSSNLDLHFKNTQKIFFSFSLFRSFFFSKTCFACYQFYNVKLNHFFLYGLVIVPGLWVLPYTDVTKVFIIKAYVCLQLDFVHGGLQFI